MNKCITLILGLMVSTITMAQIADPQIPASIEKYFNRYRIGPTLISADVSNNFKHGRVLRLKILANRNSRTADLGFAFATAAAIANRAEIPIETLIVEMNITYKGSETTYAMAPADCSIDAIILKNVDYDDWWNDCFQMQ